MRLLKNVECFCPEPTGRRDILIAGGAIEKIAEPGRINCSDADSLDCEQLFAFPGIIDAHAHILGGGGEDGSASLLAEINPEELWKAGVTSVVGVLGLDEHSKSLKALHAKARALEAQGLSTWLYTGGYSVPVQTFTGSVADDLALIDKAIGVGEVAISDHRSTLVSLKEFHKLAAEAHIGGLLGGKAGVTHIHVGDGREGLDPVLRLLDESDLPASCLIPTHMNRNESLFRQAIRYCRSGGFIDLTAGETAGVAVPAAVARLASAKADLGRVTVSSDAHGSIPGGGAANTGALLRDIRECAVSGVLPPGPAFRLITENVARALKLYPAKGVLREGSDADILLLDHDFNVAALFCMGIPVYQAGSGGAS